APPVGLDWLRDEAFSYIRSNLTAHNILKELSCSLVSRHPELLEMELDMLYAHIASAAVVADFPALARRIANKELIREVPVTPVTCSTHEAELAGVDSSSMFSYNDIPHGIVRDNVKGKRRASARGGRYLCVCDPSLEVSLDRF
ncbi:hypothetical protein OG21DRAFT_1413167, partial [Imleria badia]